MTREMVSPAGEVDAQEVGSDGDGSEEAGIEVSAGRSAAIGAIVGFVLATAAVGLACWIAFDLEPASAVALGLFCGIWGGLGFGMMVGGVVAMASTMDHA